MKSTNEKQKDIAGLQKEIVELQKQNQRQKKELEKYRADLLSLYKVFWKMNDVLIKKFAPLIKFQETKRRVDWVWRTILTSLLMLTVLGLVGVLFG